MTPLTPPRPAAAVPSLRVFVSSTFRDMQAEREELVKRVFPRLRQLCEDKGVSWGEIDLRWGITEAEAAQGKVVATCLAEAVASSVVLVLLGERYGWVPAAEHLAGLRQTYPGLGGRLSDSVTELEVVYGVFERPPSHPAHAFFYFRDPAYAGRLPPGARPGDYAAEGPGARARLAALKERARRSGRPVREPYRDAADLGRLVLGDLTDLIRRLWPGDGPADPIDREAVAHRRFAEARCRTYVGRQALFDRLDRHARGRGRPLVVSGPSGCGKTALLANWARQRLGEPADGLRLLPSFWGRWLGRPWRRRCPPAGFFFLHLVGASTGSTSWPELLRRLMGELKRHFDWQQAVPGSAPALAAALPAWLARAASRGPLVLVLDGLDALQGGDPADLSWLPAELPANVRLIVSARPGPALDALVRRGWATLAVPGLTPAERQHLVADYLRRFAKRLGPDELRAVAGVRAGPLYLRTLAEELRVFGAHERLRERLADYLRAPAVEPLFDRALARLEGDYDRDRPGLVRDALTLLAAARHGLGEPELLDLLGGPGGPLPAAYWSPFFLAVRESLVDRAGLLTFFHPDLRAAVGRRYTPAEGDRRAGHRRLADYFRCRGWSPRSVQEAPWQLSCLRAWTELRDVLADPAFLARAWPTHAAEVKAYWALLEAESPWRLADAYRAVAADPASAPEAAPFVAVLLADTGYWAEALRLSGALLGQARRRGDESARRQLLGLRAACLRGAGDGDGALRALEEQEPLSRAAGAWAELAANLSNQGALRRARGDVDRALGLHRQAEALCRDHDDPAGLAAALGSQAVIWRQRGDRGTARRLLRQQERLCRAGADFPALQQALGNLAVLCADEGDWDGALRLHREEEGLCRRLGDPAALCDCLYNQALALRPLADYDGALERLAEMARLCRERHDPPRLVAALVQTGLVYGRDLHVPAEAARWLAAAREVAVAHGLESARREIDRLAAAGRVV
jgi:tetratricopeptide (TPR) repeat protein